MMDVLGKNGIEYGFLGNLLSSMQYGMLVLAKQETSQGFSILFGNDYSCGLEGKSEVWFRGRDWMEITAIRQDENLRQIVLDLSQQSGKRAHSAHYEESVGNMVSRDYHVFHLGNNQVALVYRDVTLDKELEARIYEALDSVSDILNGLPVAVLVENERHEVLRANNAALRMFGRTLEMILDKREPGFPDGDYPPRNETREVALSGKEGQKIPVLRTEVPLVIRKTPGCLVAFTDLTEQKRLESELQHAQKMEAVGQLAAGIAHEINTPVQYIGDNMSFLCDSFRKIMSYLGELDIFLSLLPQQMATSPAIRSLQAKQKQVDLPFLLEEIPRAIQETSEGAQKVSKIVQSMKEFSHPGVDKAYLDINKALESTITLSRNVWKYVADLETEFSANLPLVECVPGEINQVFLNLIVNASHAIEDRNETEKKGKITIRTSCKGQFVIVEVSDNGVGIPDSVKQRIFDPFFTTKGVGRGTGQGLYLAHKCIVDSHRGKIEFRTEVGKGTVFVVYLPVDSGKEDG